MLDLSSSVWEELDGNRDQYYGTQKEGHNNNSRKWQRDGQDGHLFGWDKGWILRMQWIEKNKMYWGNRNEDRESKREIKGKGGCIYQSLFENLEGHPETEVRDTWKYRTVEKSGGVWGVWGVSVYSVVLLKVVLFILLQDNKQFIMGLSTWPINQAWHGALKQLVLLWEGATVEAMMLLIASASVRKSTLAN